jgi:hypothetical protein
MLSQSKRFAVARKAQNSVELEKNVARRMKASWWAVAAAVLFTVSTAGAQTAA